VIIDLSGGAEAADSSFAVLGPNVRIPLTPDVIDRETRRLIAEAKAAEQRLNSSAIALNTIGGLIAKAKAKRLALGHDPVDWRAASDAQNWLEIVGRFAAIVTGIHAILTERAARAEATRIAGVIG
jgi:hypothetical protein